MKSFFLFLVCCGCFACESPNTIPDDILSINQMKPIVWDMIRADAFSKDKFAKDTAGFKKQTLKTYEQVFKIYDIDEDIFYNSYRYYLGHPDKNKILMDSVVAYSNRKRMDLFKKIE